MPPSADWEPPSSALPRLGELILLRCDFRAVTFPYGPASVIPLSQVHGHAPSPSPSPSAAPSPQPPPAAFPAPPSVVSISAMATPSVNPRSKLGTYHMFLVSAVVASSGTVKLLPVLSYSKKPGSAVWPSDTPWDADAWMRGAPAINRLHHIPVPATMPDGTMWNPPRNPSDDTPNLIFGQWTNDRPSWVIVRQVSAKLTGRQQPTWLRRTGGAIMLHDVVGLLNFLLSFPTILQRLQWETAAAEADNEGEEGEQLLVQAFGLPDEDEIWARILCEGGPDPVTFWNFAGAPEPLRREAIKAEKLLHDAIIFEWDDGQRCGPRTEHAPENPDRFPELCGPPTEIGPKHKDWFDELEDFDLSDSAYGEAAVR